MKVFEGLSDPAVTKYYGVSFNTPEETQQQMDWYDELRTHDTGVWWAINLNGAMKMIGACGVYNISKEHSNAEIGYWLLPEFWKKGYVREVLPLVIAFARHSLNLHRLSASIEPGNISSKNSLLASEFEYEGTTHESELKNGKFIDLEYYGLIL